MIEVLNNWATAIRNKILGIFETHINVESTVLRKRSVSNSTFDKYEISSDEESDDYATAPTKRPRIDQPEEGYFEHRPSPMSEMYATWIQSRSGFENCYKICSETSRASSKGDGKENQYSSSAGKVNLSCRPFDLLSDHPSMNAHKNSFAQNQNKHSISASESVHKMQSRQRLSSLHCKDSFNNIKHPKQNGSTIKSTNKITKRGCTAQHCIQLAEREKYRQLIQSYNNGYRTPVYSETSFSSKKLAPTFTNYKKDKKDKAVSEFPNGRSILPRKYLLQEKLGTEEQKMYTTRILNERTIRSLNVSAFSNGIAEKTDIELNTKTFPKTKISSQESVKIELDDDHSDNSVIITKVEPSKWRPTKTSEYIPKSNYESSEWLKQWNSEWKAVDNERKIEIEKAEREFKLGYDMWQSRLEDLELDMREQLRLSQEKTEIIREVLSSEDIEEEAELLPELTPEMEDQIDKALHPLPPDEVLVEAFRLQIRRRDMETLQDQNWLNDEVINFYMNMLMERGKQDNMPSVYACNTFFYPKLISGGHGALKRWTRKIDIFAHDIMLVPVHLGVHWCLAVINFKDRTLKYYDSMGGKNNECLHALCEYLKAESLDKKKQTFDMTDWIIENAKDIPQQMNSSDCGMFACKYAEYLTRDSKITFKQEHMPYFRRRMVYEIISKTLM